MFQYGNRFNIIETKENIPKEKKKSVGIYCIDETLLKVGSQYVWVWVAAIEPLAKVILDILISFERTMLIAAERFLKDLIELENTENIHFHQIWWWNMVSTASL